MPRSRALVVFARPRRDAANLTAEHCGCSSTRRTDRRGVHVGADRLRQRRQGRLRRRRMLVGLHPAVPARHHVSRRQRRAAATACATVPRIATSARPTAGLYRRQVRRLPLRRRRNARPVRTTASRAISSQSVGRRRTVSDDELARTATAPGSDGGAGTPMPALVGIARPLPARARARRRAAWASCTPRSIRISSGASRSRCCATRRRRRGARSGCCARRARWRG